MKLLSLLLLFSLTLCAQSQTIRGGDFNAGGARSTTPTVTGFGAPTSETCAVPAHRGRMYTRLDAVSAQAAIYVCLETSAGVLAWTAQSGSNSLPLPTASTLGGVKSKTCDGSDKVSALGTDGVLTCSAGGGSSSPGGTDTQLQYNDADGFGGVTGSIVNNANRTLSFLDALDNHIVDLTTDLLNGDPTCNYAFSINCSSASAPATATDTGNDGPDISITGIHGGNTTNAGEAYAGVGGLIVLISGNGGSADSGTVSSWGGDAGDLALMTGDGGTSTTGTGGYGGNIEITPGTGGAGGAGTGNDGTTRINQGGHHTSDIVQFNSSSVVSRIRPTGAFGNLQCTAATLAAAIANAGDQCYCTDCKVTASDNNTCTGTGGGAMAFNIASTAKCVQ